MTIQRPGATDRCSTFSGPWFLIHSTEAGEPAHTDPVRPAHPPPTTCIAGRGRRHTPSASFSAIHCFRRATHSSAASRDPAQRPFQDRGRGGGREGTCFPSPKGLPFEEHPPPRTDFHFPNKEATESDKDKKTGPKNQHAFGYIRKPRRSMTLSLPTFQKKMHPKSRRAQELRQKKSRRRPRNTAGSRLSTRKNPRLMTHRIKALAN